MHTITPDLATAYTCPACGHRNYLEMVPKELSPGQIADLRSEGGDEHDVTSVVGPGEGAECLQCGVAVQFAPYSDDLDLIRLPRE